MRYTAVATTLAAFLLASSALAGGCARREHIRENHGEMSQAWHDMQRRAADDTPATGLDPEEAAAIHERYRRVLSGDAPTGPDRSDILILEEPGR